VRENYDVAIVGGGGAGLSLLLAIERAAARAGKRAPSLLLVDPVRRSASDRTWCWWTPDDHAGHWFDELLTGEWTSVTVAGPRTGEQRIDLAPFRYVMLRSVDLYDAATRAAERLDVERVDATVTSITGDGELRTDQGHRFRAAAVFDSRPAAPARPGRTMLLQHFRGWTVRFDEPVLEPTNATLMDFRVAQPTRGVAFAYTLPTGKDRALVEYTEFSRGRRTPAEYELALRAYLEKRWGVAPGHGITIEHEEDGVIPMTDAPFPRRAGERVFRIGTAGGATRPSTGYTFAAMQRQAEQIAGPLIEGRAPVPPKPYPAHHLWLDAVLLRALDRGYVNGADLFTGLFARNPPKRLLRFLDGVSTPAEELAVMRTSPTSPMLRATVEDALARLTQRSRSVATRHRW
jgi:lycopene beta-cyclase